MKFTEEFTIWFLSEKGLKTLFGNICFFSIVYFNFFHQVLMSLQFSRGTTGRIYKDQYKEENRSIDNRTIQYFYTSLQNAIEDANLTENMLSKNQLKEIQSLQLKKQRDLKKLFIAEGVKTVVEILTHFPGSLNHLYGTRGFFTSHAPLLKMHNVSFTNVSDEELGKISLQTKPNQVLAVCNFLPDRDISYKPTADFSFYLDDIRDPGNMGTIIRLSDWFGITTIFCSPETCDLYNPKVIQSTMGSFLRVNVVYIELKELLLSWKIKNIYGAVLKGKNIYHEKLEAGLILIGNEANGIRPENMNLISKGITIPKHSESGTESLNAAVATSIIASEFYRQLKS